MTDIDEDRAAKVAEDCDVDVVESDAIYDVHADIFASCALGAVVNDDTIDRFNFDIIAGSANNQLARGGIYDPALAERSRRKAGEIYHTLLRIFELAESEGIGTHAAANKVAGGRLLEARHLQRT